MKDKKVIFGIILFLLIGFTIFTFANPSENEKTFNDDNKSEEKVDNSKEDNSDTANEENTITQNNTATNNDVSNSISSFNLDSSDTNNDYNNALKAVEKSEVSLNQSDLNAAKELVNNLETSDDKTSLENRVNAVQNIIDASSLVANLEQQVKNAKSKTNITDAKDYRDNSNVVTKVNNITNNEETKQDLLNRLNTLALILDDNIIPTIEGINTEYTNQEVILTISDENGYTALLNNNPYNSGDKISEDGVYTLTVVDDAYNTNSVTFTIDSTNPSITLPDGGNIIDDITYYKNSVLPIISDTNLDTVKLVKDNSEIEYNIADEINEDGKYTLTVTDKAGNISEVTFIVDKTVPQANYSNGNIVTEKVVEITDTNFYYMTVENKLTGKTETINENKFTLPSVDADNVRYTIVAYDKSLNKTKKLDIYHDNMNPVVEGTGVVGDEEVTLENDGVYKKVTLKISDGSLKKIVKVNNNNEEILEEFKNNYTNKKLTFEKTFDQDGVYKIKATDRMGLTSEITFTVDTTLPTLDGLYDGFKTNKTISLHAIDDNFDYIHVKNVTTGKEFNEKREWTGLYDDGVYEFQVFDKAGNASNKITVEKDSIAAVRSAANILVSGDGNSLSEYYAKIGDKINCYVSFNEKLMNNPTFTLINNGNELNVDLSRIEEPNKDGKYIYGIEYEIDENTLMTDGEITFKVSNLMDEFGNTINDITVASNGHRVFFDKTVPIASVSYSTTNPTNKEVIATLINASEEITIINNEGKSEYTFTENGEFEFTFEDKAGNVGKALATVNNIDKIAAENVYTLILTNTSYNNALNYNYAKNGDKIRVLAKFNEELYIPENIDESTFELKINNTSVKFLRSQDTKNSDGTEKYEYIAEYIIPEDETNLEEGKLKFEIVGYTDLAGNTSEKVITEANHEKYNSVIYDRTKTSYKILDINTNEEVKPIEIDGIYYFNKDIKISFVDNYKIAQMKSNTWTHNAMNEERTAWTETIKEDIKKEIKVTDASGNITQMTVVVDKTNPEFVDAEKTLESDVTINVKDDNLDKIVLNDKNTNETYEVENGHVLKNEGFYKIIAYDKAGNENVWNLTIDNNAPIITIENANQNNLYNTDVVINISDLELNQTYLNDKRQGRVSKLTVTEEGTHTVWAQDNFGHKSEVVTFTIDKTVLVDKLEIYPAKNNAFYTIGLFMGEEIVKPDGFVMVSPPGYGENTAFHRGYYPQEESRVEYFKVTDLAGNTKELSITIPSLDETLLLELKGDTEVVLLYNETFDESKYGYTVSAYKQSESDITVTTVQNNTKNGYEIVYTATDKYNNTRNSTRKIITYNKEQTTALINRQVEIALESTYQSDIDRAKSYINRLPDGEEKTNAMKKLTDLEEDLALKALIKEATQRVNNYLGSGYARDLSLAKNAIENLAVKDLTAANELSEKINQFEKNWKDAKQKRDNYFNSKYETDYNKAITATEKLPEGLPKKYLLEELNNFKTKYDEELKITTAINNARNAIKAYEGSGYARDLDIVYSKIEEIQEESKSELLEELNNTITKMNNASNAVNKYLENPTDENKEDALEKVNTLVNGPYKNNLLSSIK